MELYLSSNQISNRREIFPLKSLCLLIVLDLTFNPVHSVETYRAFVVFHLPFLKALDGRPIVRVGVYIFYVSCEYCDKITQSCRK